jgi:TPP-dependent pyruvate/acetoin dehydrogenase alpha subunit
MYEAMSTPPSTVLVEMYRRMLRIRLFEEAATRLAMDGEIPGLHSSIGQEGAIVGACMALETNDYITGTHRSHGHPIGKGADLGPLMAELCGKVTGICKGLGGSMHLADSKVGCIGESAIVGGGIPIAVGAGLSIQVRGTHQVSLCFFGDGASNEGTFGESLNLASIWRLPVIFVCENNGYAISTPTSKSLGQPDIAKRAVAYGIPGEIVDGQDVLAVHKVTSAAVHRARRGEGPTLIEAKTYRFDEHCFALQVPIPYRTAEEVEDMRRRRDPITLHAAHLGDAGVNALDLEGTRGEVEAEVKAALQFARSSPFPTQREADACLFSNPLSRE